MYSQKLTKVDKEWGGGGGDPKLISASYQISMTKIMTFIPLGPFLLFMKAPLDSLKFYLFPISFCHIETTCQNMFLWPKL